MYGLLSLLPLSVDLLDVEYGKVTGGNAGDLRKIVSNLEWRCLGSVNPNQIYPMYRCKRAALLAAKDPPKMSPAWYPFLPPKSRVSLLVRFPGNISAGQDVNLRLSE
jgi:hypothetical protein